MLGDSILIVIALMLIVMGIQPMLDDENRKNSVEVMHSVTMVMMGLFLIMYWNSIVP
jgi:hypothetical protein